MSYSGRKVLITGADGFIGSHLVEALAATGAEVTALAQYDAFGRNGWLDDLKEEIRSQISIKRGDIRDAAFVHRLVTGHEVVFHLAALIAVPHSYDSPQSYVDVNVNGTLNVLEACRASTIERLIHTSTSEVYGTAQFTPISEAHPVVAQSPYSASKIGADMMVAAFVRSFGLPAVILRPFNTYGPRQSERAVLPTVIRQALDPECDAIRLGNLSPIRDFNYVGDIVRAFELAGLHSGLEFGTPHNAGSGVSISVGDAVELVRELCGTNKPVESETTRYRPEGSEVFELLADAGRFSAETGWRSTVDLRTGLAETIAWWRGRTSRAALRRDRTYLC